MAKYHIKKDGSPGICKAQEGACPLGGSNEHFGSMEEAQKHADAINEKSSKESLKEKKTKSRAQLMKDAKAGNISLEMVEYQGGEVPDYDQGIRPVIGTSGKSIVTQGESGGSMVHIPEASLIEYTNDELIVYDHGFREPTPEEKEALDEWQKVTQTEEYRQDRFNDVYRDGSDTYYQEVEFFQKKNMEHLASPTFKGGAMLNPVRQRRGEKAFIADKKVKGEVRAKYKVHSKES